MRIIQNNCVYKCIHEFENCTLFTKNVYTIQYNTFFSKSSSSKEVSEYKCIHNFTHKNVAK